MHDDFYTYFDVTVNGVAAATPAAFVMAYSAGQCLASGPTLGEVATSATNSVKSTAVSTANAALKMGDKAATVLLGSSAGSFGPPLAAAGAYGGLKFYPAINTAETTVAVSKGVATTADSFGGPLGITAAMPIIMDLGGDRYMILGRTPAEDTYHTWPKDFGKTPPDAVSRAIKHITNIKNPFAQEVLPDILHRMRINALSPADGEAMLVAASEVLAENPTSVIRNIVFDCEAPATGNLVGLTRKVIVDGIERKVTVNVEVGYNPTALKSVN